MSDCRWHKMSFPCKQCSDEMMITAFATSADGEALLELACIKCGKQFQWRRFFTQLIYEDTVSDLEEKPPKPLVVKPPLRLPPPQQTEQDRQWLKDLGIEGL